MKKTIIILFAFILAINVNAQKKTTIVKDSFEVNGNCGMCKRTIEKAAKKAGASFANWSDQTHILQITYAANKTNNKKIQELIAKMGYDNVGATSTDAAYNNLHGCCKYERKKM
jgi:hypothetical protein